MTLLLAGALAILVGATLQRICGAGVGMVVAPTLALVLGPAQGVLVTNAATVTSGFLIMLAVRHHVDWRRAIPIALAAAPGAVVGALVVRSLSAGWLQILIGGTVLLGLITSVALPNLPHVRSRAAMLTAGLIGGFFNTAAGVAAPAMVIYSRLSRWEQTSFGATLQPIFMTMGVWSVATKTALGSVPAASTPPWWFAVVVVLAVSGGIVLGGRASRRIGPQGARRLALVIAGTGATLTLARGILAMLP